MLYASWGIIKVAIGFLLERVPAGVDLDSIGEELGRIPGVEDVHHIHAWSLTSGVNIFSSHVKTSEDADAQTVLKAAHALLEKVGVFYFSTVQVENECIATPGADEIDIMSESVGGAHSMPAAPDPHAMHH